MEKWKKLLPEKYRHKEYITILSFGEEDGLIIKLESFEEMIELDFGIVEAIRIFDEGMVQDKLFNDVYSDDGIIHNFDDVLYEVEDGEFMRFANSISFNRGKQLNLKHYIVITLNYIMEILTMYEVDIVVSSE